ncbi:cation:proton antiporter [Aliikangiella sp. IMCC44359]|uniref:cation:proton antiporter n=1 Tax=Aliikangiella sp. IMCC44359 TaxID=3459125 RepID=UPI00403AE46E
MDVTMLFLIAMLIIYTVPYLIWRLGNTESYAPLVVVQIVAGILLGPGVLGAVYPEEFKFIFHSDVVVALNAIASWAIMLFVWIAGIELDLHATWKNRHESLTCAGLALGTPMMIGVVAAIGLLFWQEGWMGEKAMTWQFIVGVGMSCAVTALPILLLFLEKLDILRQDLGQRILRYASLDDIAIWGVLALILMDWQRIQLQGLFLLGFISASWLFRKIIPRLNEKDRWYVSLIWLLGCSLAADVSGLHFMVGAFLAGVVLDASWFDGKQMDTLRNNVLLVLMPVFFLSTGLRTTWEIGAYSVFIAAAVLLIASVGGKLLGVKIAGKILGWSKKEASIIGWLLQTKALIMIIFANILLDKAIITSGTFTALLLMAVVSTMLAIPMASPILQRMKSGDKKTADEKSGSIKLPTKPAVSS